MAGDVLHLLQHLDLRLKSVVGTAEKSRAVARDFNLLIVNFELRGTFDLGFFDHSVTAMSFKWTTSTALQPRKCLTLFKAKKNHTLQGFSRTDFCKLVLLQIESVIVLPCRG